MTEKEMEQAMLRLQKITTLKECLKRAAIELAWANKNIKDGKVYRAEVELIERNYQRSQYSVALEIDAGVVQQSLLNKVNQFRREIVALGGDLP